MVKVKPWKVSLLPSLDVSGVVTAANEAPVAQAGSTEVTGVVLEIMLAVGVLVVVVPSPNLNANIDDEVVVGVLVTFEDKGDATNLKPLVKAEAPPFLLDGENLKDANCVWASGSGSSDLGALGLGVSQAAHFVFS